MQALCKRFHDHCSKAGLQLPPKGFRLSYDTNIPRQAGLSGSSAIICAGGHISFCWILMGSNQHVRQQQQQHPRLTAICS
jgi:galactokinase